MTTLDLDELEAPVASSRRQSGDQHLPGPLLIDAHVHLQRRVAPAALLEAAHANLARARAGLGLNADALGCLVFTDAAGEDAFGALLSSLAPSSGWRIARTGEDHSLLALKGLELRLLLIGGRQVRTREGLEVLAVGTRAAIADGEPLNVTLSAVRRFGAFPILPWGFGKWWGQRGRLMARIAHAAEPGTLALGDNAGRPRAAPRPYPFRQALKRGLPVLPGSDPLPLGGHTARAGSFGFVLNGPFERAQPARAICRRLATLGHQPRVFGARAALGRVALDQLALRVVGRRPG